MTGTSKKLDEYMEEFLLYKHKMGYTYVTHAFYLKKFVQSILGGNPDSMPTKENVNAYLSKIKDRPGTLYGTVCVIREFLNYLNRLGLEVYLLPAKTASQPTPNPPYFFTSNEIIKFFEAADSIPAISGLPGREIIIPAFFRLMYCCGIRCKEARLLRCSDVSFDEKYIDIMQSKGPKDRRLFISDELTAYLEEYDQRISKLYAGREYFFPGFYTKHPYLSTGFVEDNFHRCWDTAFPDFKGKTYPRAYDFRHHFAWANINKWAADGLDVNVLLPYLMKYMGHASVNHTLYYFHFVPDFFPTYQSMTAGSDDVIPEIENDEEE